MELTKENKKMTEQAGQQEIQLRFLHEAIEEKTEVANDLLASRGKTFEYTIEDIAISPNCSDNIHAPLSKGQRSKAWKLFKQFLDSRQLGSRQVDYIEVGQDKKGDDGRKVRTNQKVDAAAFARDNDKEIRK